GLGDSDDPFALVAGGRGSREPARRSKRTCGRSGRPPMKLDDDALGRTLSALKRELASVGPPSAVDRSVAAAIERAERAAASPMRLPWRMRREQWVAPVTLAAAAAVALIVWTLRVPPTDPPQRAATAPVATEFIPVVPVADIARTRGAYVVSTQMPRTMLADFGLPV